MSQQTKETKTGPESAQRLRALFEKWSREDAETDHDDEPRWEAVKKALNEGRPTDSKPFSED